MRLTGDTYIGRLGVLCPDSYLPLHGALYHLAAAEVVPGQPSQLRVRLRLRRAGGLLALLGNAPTEWEVRVPVPVGNEVQVAQVVTLAAPVGREVHGVGPGQGDACPRDCFFTLMAHLGAFHRYARVCRRMQKDPCAGGRLGRLGEHSRHCGVLSPEAPQELQGTHARNGPPKGRSRHAA